MQLKHIDTGFYRLTEHQARRLAVDGKLPTQGHIKLAALKDIPLTLLRAARYPDAKGNIVWEPRPFDPGSVRSGWIMPTPCGWHDGHPIESGWVWSIVFFWKTPFGEKWLWHAR